MATLAETGPAEAMACIDKAIASGWQGLFPRGEDAEPVEPAAGPGWAEERNPTREDVAVGLGIPVDEVAEIDGD